MVVDIDMEMTPDLLKDDCIYHIFSHSQDSGQAKSMSVTNKVVTNKQTSTQIQSRTDCLK